MHQHIADYAKKNPINWVSGVAYTKTHTNMHHSLRKAIVHSFTA